MFEKAKAGMQVWAWAATAIRKHLRLVFGLGVLVVGLLTLYLIYTQILHVPVIRSDGQGYYAYLPSVLIYHDVTLNRMIQGPLHGSPPHGAVRWPGTKSYLLKYPAGEAVLMSPFFLLGWLGALLFHQPADGFSPPFQYAAAFSSLVYAVLGLLILWTVLQKNFKPTTVLIGLVCILFGSDLFHYATFDPSFSHVYSFFLFAVLLYLVERIYRQPRLLEFVLIGITAGLILITRPSNALWILFCLLVGISTMQDIRERLGFWKLHWKEGLLAIASFLGIASIQVLYWESITGLPVVYSYTGEFFNFAKPQVFNVLFSVRKGLFFWSPILLTVFPGLFFVRKLARTYFLPILIFFPLNIFVISSWTTWWYGDSFGQRPFAESMPMFAIALCALYEGLEGTVWKRVLVIFLIMACALSIWLMLKYWFGVLPYDGVTWPLFVRTFWQVQKP